MKAIKYVAPDIHKTWAKEGYLFENGIFLCNFSYHTAPSYICRRYDFNNPPETLTWGKGVIDPNSIYDQPGAVTDYQTFQRKEIVNIDFDNMKKESATRFYWTEDHHPSKRLESI